MFFLDSLLASDDLNKVFLCKNTFSSWLSVEIWCFEVTCSHFRIHFLLALIFPSNELAARSYTYAPTALGHGHAAGLWYMCHQWHCAHFSFSLEKGQIRHCLAHVVNDHKPFKNQFNLDHKLKDLSRVFTRSFRAWPEFNNILDTLNMTCIYF